jgi:hypothetical protein
MALHGRSAGYGFRAVNGSPGLRTSPRRSRGRAAQSRQPVQADADTGDPMPSGANSQVRPIGTAPTTSKAAHVPSRFRCKLLTFGKSAPHVQKLLCPKLGTARSWAIPKQERRLCGCSIEPYLVGTRRWLFAHTGYPEYVMKSEPLERVAAVVNNIARTADKLPPQSGKLMKQRQAAGWHP